MRYKYQQNPPAISLFKQNLPMNKATQENKTDGSPPSRGWQNYFRGHIGWKGSLSNDWKKERVPKYFLRQITAGLKHCSAWLLVGSTCSLKIKVHKAEKWVSRFEQKRLLYLLVIPLSFVLFFFSFLEPYFNPFFLFAIRHVLFSFDLLTRYPW